MERLAAEPSADGLDAVLAALGAACAVRRPDFPAPEDGEMCLGVVPGGRLEPFRLEIYKTEACVYC